MGQKATVEDAVCRRAFAYTSDLQLDTESIDADGADGGGDGLYTKLITRKYGTITIPINLKGKDKGFQVGTSVGVRKVFLGVRESLFAMSRS